MREWMEIGEDEFYDASRIAIIPMGFCFPGSKPGSGDLPPRRECSEIWHEELSRRLPGLKLLLALRADMRAALS